VLKPADPESMVEAVLKAKKLIEDEERREKNEGDLKRLVKETQLALRGSALPEQENAATNQMIKEILDYIERYYMENITLAHLGNHVHLSPVYLSRLMKKETGETFLDILTRVRILKAVELMKDPRIKTYEVARRVGINDPRYFGQVFKKQFGITPLEFRKRRIG
jgi:two-component system response regulator YesN